MNYFKKTIKNIFILFGLDIKKTNTKKIVLKPKKKSIAGRVLFSYLESPLLWRENDPRLNYHTNLWESTEIARILNELGFLVEAINYKNNSYQLISKYDVIFDIYTNLQRWAPFLGKNVKKLLHLAGSYSYYNNYKELKRVSDLEKRKNVLYTPKRLVENIQLYNRSLQLANY